MLYLAVSVLCGLAAARASSPVVSTAQGQLRGSVLQSVTGRAIFSFRGVRFAQPPTGSLRFRETLPPEPWQGVRNATEDGNVCLQRTALGVLSEDCLFLNVYSTKLPDRSENPMRPVMVWFHAGGFYSVTGNSVVHGPQYLMDQDIVLVTTNYRLGALGFLSAQDSVLRGNYGMKDQVQVLRWVNQNIASFGGDPNSVTISGYSAGSMSVILHMMSPMSQGLFHRCIAMSGSPTIQMHPGNPLAQVHKQAALLNCPTNSTQQIVDCLRQMKANDIAATLYDFREWGRDPMLMFGPVVEPDLGDGAERFLTADPTELLLSGNFSHVPLITGITTEEFSWRSLLVLDNTSWAEDMSRNFETVAPIAFLYERGTERSHNISRYLCKFYLKDQPITNASRVGLGQLYADAIIGFGEDRAAKLISRVSSAPVYFYKYSYQGRYSHEYYPRGSTTPYGVVHHDDLISLFYISTMFPLFKERDQEYQTMLKMTKMWANFIRTGNPTPELSTLLNQVQWQRFTSQNLKYLDIGSTLVMSEGLYQDRMAVWENIFPLPLSSNSHHQTVKQSTFGEK